MRSNIEKKQKQWNRIKQKEEIDAKGRGYLKEKHVKRIKMELKKKCIYFD